MTQLFEDLNLWFATNRGKRLAKDISQRLTSCWSDISGQRLLQLGISEQQNWLNSSAIDKKMILLPYQTNSNCTVVSSLYELPIESASIDLIFCPFVMEIIHHKMSFLCEADRILAADGQIIFCGVNPISLWGLPRLWRQRSLFPLWRIGLYSMNKLSGDLQRLGYSIEMSLRFGYWPPCVNQAYYQRFFEYMGRMILPFPSNFYLLSAKKHVVRPIIASWDSIQAVANGDQLA